MVKKDTPKGRRGLRPWGLSHTYNFRKDTRKNDDGRVLFTMESVYSVRLKLPKYVWAVYRGSLISEKDIQDLGITWARKLNQSIGLTQTAKVIDFNFRTEAPEMTIDIVVPDVAKNMDAFIRHVLPIIKSAVKALLEIFKTAIFQKLETQLEYMGYFIIKRNGKATKNGTIRWRRPRLRGV